MRINGKTLDNLELKQDLAQELYNLYFEIQQATRKFEGNDESEKEIKILKESIETIFLDMKEKGKIEFLKNRICDLLEDDTNTKTQEKLQKFFGEYYQKLVDKIDNIKDSEEQEKIIIGLIKDSDVKIYEHKEKIDYATYGDFIQNTNQEVIRHEDNDIRLIELASYITKKNSRQQQNRTIRENMDDENLSKYRLDINHENQWISLIFFGEKELGEKIEDKKEKTKYFGPMLAAIGKAHEKGRAHIGRIFFDKFELEDECISLPFTQYDDDLERAVKNLKEREEKQKNENDKEKVNQTEKGFKGE